MDAKKRQHEIKELLQRFGITQAAAARWVYREQNEVDDPDEIVKFEEKFKKQLSRDTTSAKRLGEILRILRRHPTIRKANKVTPDFVASPLLDARLQRELRVISRSLDEEIARIHEDE